jgi:small subunit ribosomal protein S21
MLIVEIKGGNIESALKQYKRKVQSVKQVEQLRDRKEYIKPSITRREVLEKAKQKNKKIYNFF